MKFNISVVLFSIKVVLREEYELVVQNSIKLNNFRRVKLTY